MNMDELVWDFLSIPATDQMIEQVEQTLAIQLPSDYLDIARVYHGAMCGNARFDFYGPDGNKMTSGFSGLFSFDPEDEYGEDMFSNNVNITSRPPGLIAIARDGGDGFICFDYSLNQAAPRVVFWIQSYEPDQPFFLGDSFTDFIHRAYQP